MNTLLYFTPLIGAFIGWLTTALTLKLLFYPRIPFTFGLISIQGVIPKHSAKISEELGALLIKELHLEEILHTQLESSAFKQELEQVLDLKLEDFVIALRQQIPMGEMFLTGALSEKLKNLAKVELIKMTPGLAKSLMVRLSQRDDLQQFVRQQMGKLDQAELECVVGRIVGKDGKWLCVIGAVVGFVVGVVCLLIGIVMGGVVSGIS